MKFDPKKHVWFDEVVEKWAQLSEADFDREREASLHDLLRGVFLDQIDFLVPSDSNSDKHVDSRDRLYLLRLIPGTMVMSPKMHIDLFMWKSIWTRTGFMELTKGSRWLLIGRQLSFLFN